MDLAFARNVCARTLLALMFFVASAHADDKADHAAMVSVLTNCVSDAMAAMHSTGVDMVRLCVGRQTAVCSAGAPSTSMDMLECVDAETAAWTAMTETSFAALMERYSSDDTRVGLTAAHEAWKTTHDSDCAFRAARWGGGTNARLESYTCLRDAFAERAITYMRWLDEAAG